MSIHMPANRKTNTGKLIIGCLTMVLGVFALMHSIDAQNAHASTPMAAASAMRVAFSPGDGDGTAQQLVIDEVGKANKQILVAAYEFTSAPIARAIVDAKNRGVDVKAVLDRTQAKEGYSAAKFLADAGIEVRIDYVPAIMHDKFLCIDGATLETGSFNYTTSAAKRNAENAIAIDDPQLVVRYANEWLRLWQESQPYGS